jgi:hypothetical protein
VNLPKARATDIIEQEAGRELLIYDLSTNRMFQLNETSKIVYQACGKLSFDELKRKHKLTDDLIHLALDELQRNNLLENPALDYFAGLSRREVIKRAGLATMIALPIVSSLVAPHAARAASQTFAPGSRTLNQSCNTSTDCNQQASAPDCVAVRGQSNTGRACCLSGTVQPVFLPGGDPNGGGTVTYGSQASCQNAVSPQCCSRAATCTCTANGNGTVRCTSVCQ